MGEADLDRDCILICYENDGEEIASYIKNKLSDVRYRCCVSLVDISDDESPIACGVQLSILLLTPGMRDAMNHIFDSNRLNTIFTSPRNSLVVRYSVDDDDDVHELLASEINGFRFWNSLEMGTTSDDIKSLMIKIMELVDKPPSLKQFSILPKKVYSSQDDVCLIIKKSVEGTVSLWVKEDKTEIKPKQLNSSTFTFKLKGLSPGMKNIDAFEDNVCLGTASVQFVSKMDAIGGLLYDINNPQELLCQVLRVNNPDDLDLELCDILTNGKQHVDSLEQLGNISPSATVDNTKCELPTLLHFGARFGLRGFCNKLLQHPGARLALNITNRSGLTPQQIAIQEGFPELQKDLKPFLLADDESDTDDHYVDMSQNHPLPFCPGSVGGRTLSLGTFQNAYTTKTEVRPTRSLTAIDEMHKKYRNKCRHGMVLGFQNTKSATSGAHNSSVSTQSHDSGVSVTEMSERVSLLLEDSNWVAPPLPRESKLFTKM